MTLVEVKGADECRMSRLGRVMGVSFLAALSGAIMPGPVLAACIEQTARQGFRAVWGILAGHAALELVLVVLLMLGLRGVIARPRVRGVVAMVGGMAMIWMGMDMAMAAAGVRVDLGAAGAGGAGVHSGARLVMAGVVLSLANPYFIGWWATIGTGQLAKLGPRGVLEYAGFYVGHEAGDYLWYGFVGLLIVTGRKWILGPAYQGMILGCSAAIVIIGVWFMWSSIGLMRGGKAALPCRPS